MPPGFFFLAPWIVLIPVIGLLINIAVGRRMSEWAVGTVAVLGSGLPFVVSLLLAYSLTLHPEPVRWLLAPWIHIGNLALDWTFRVDTLSVTMMLVVSGVGTLIHVYAIGYMHEDVRFKGDTRRFARFFVFMNLFIAAMMILVSGDSYLTLFVGWEGVGLCSFLLIGFWYEMDTLGRPSWANSDAAKKAMIANRIGDFGFLIAAFMIFWGFGTLQFDGVFEKVLSMSAINSPFIVAITLFLLLGVTGKSAQIPLYVWLPDAMAGPTPVSALIHAATMVTAGVYLVARSAPLYTAAPAAQFVVALVGAVTALFAATIAVGQFDIKKVLAYSTISQLGFMVAAVGMGAFAAGMFHLVTHAFFKALLFLSAGSIILGVERGHHLLGHHGEHESYSAAKPPKGARKAAEPHAAQPPVVPEQAAFSRRRRHRIWAAGPRPGLPGRPAVRRHRPVCQQRRARPQGAHGSLRALRPIRQSDHRRGRTQRGDHEIRREQLPRHAHLLHERPRKPVRNSRRRHRQRAPGDRHRLAHRQEIPVRGSGIRRILLSEGRQGPAELGTGGRPSSAHRECR